MMKRFLVLLVFLLLPSVAQAQSGSGCTGLYPSQTVCGNAGPSSNIAAPIAISSFALPVVSVKAPPYNAKCDGTTNDTAAIAAAVLGAAGKNLFFPAGSVCLSDPVIISSATAVPTQITGYGASLKQRTAGSGIALLIENPNLVSGYSGLTMAGLTVDANGLGGNAIRIHGSQQATLKGSVLHMIDVAAVGQTAGNCGLNLFGESGFGVYSNQFDNLHLIGGIGTGLCTQSTSGSTADYVQGNTFNNLFVDGATTQGVYIDKADNTYNGMRVESVLSGPCVSLNRTNQNTFTGGHTESCLSSGVDTSFAGTAGMSLGIQIYGTRTSGVITGLNGYANNVIAPACAAWDGSGTFCQTGLSAAFNTSYLQTQGIGFNAQTELANTLNWPSVGHLAISGTDAALIVPTGIKIPTSGGLSMGGLTPVADSINYSATNGLSLLKGGSFRGEFIDGLQLGSTAPTGGDKGQGTVNVASAYYANGVQIIPSTPGAAGTVLQGVGIGSAPTYTAQPTLGQNGGTLGQIVFNGSSSGSAVLSTPAAAGTGTIFTLPATNGTTTWPLVTNGSGITSWSQLALSTGVTGLLGLANGGSNASLPNDLGGIVYSSGASLAMLAHTNTANLPLLSGNANAPTWASFTYPTSVSSGGIAYWSSTALNSSAAISGLVLGNGASAPTAFSAGSGVLTALGNTAGGAGGFALVGTNPYNLTGPITSVGNTTSIASQTGTGTKFVVDTSPTLITPVLGVASGTSLALNGANTNIAQGVAMGAVGSPTNTHGFIAADSGWIAYTNGAASITFTSSPTLETFGGNIAVAAMTQTSVAQSGTVCYNSGTGAITYDATLGCLASSSRFKTNIRPITNNDALAMVMQLKPVTFNKREDAGGDIDKAEQVGFVAEDVAEVDPRLVAVDSDGQTRGVRYQQNSALYAGAIQALKADNDNLRACQQDWKCRIFGRQP